MSKYSNNYTLIDWSGFKPVMTAKVGDAGKSNGPAFMPDIAEFRSPIDGKLIGSRSTLREHEKRHGVRQVGNDLKPEDYNSTKPVQIIERAFEAAYRIALAKTGQS